MRHFRSRTRGFKREVKTFGDLVTFDFVTASGDHEVEGRYALIIRDTHTGILMAYPTEETLTPSSGLSSTSAGEGKSAGIFG